MIDTLDNNEQLDFMVDEVEIIPSTEQGRAIAAIESYYEQTMALTKQAAVVLIEDAQSSARALNICADAKNLSSKIEADRKRFVAPKRQEIQRINDCAKGLQETISVLISTIMIKLAGWSKEQELESEKAQEAVKSLSESLGINMVIMAPNPPKNLSSDKAMTCTRERLTFDIVDANLVPDEYWIIDPKAIQKHVDLGKRDIPGIKLKTEKTMIIRRK